VSRPSPPSAWSAPAPPATTSSPGLAVVDDPEPLGGDGAPHVGADVDGGGLHRATTVRVQEVGREAAFLLGHRDEGRPSRVRVALEGRPVRLGGRRDEQRDDQ
jgi:hypothetical protein